MKIVKLVILSWFVLLVGEAFAQNTPASKVLQDTLPPNNNVVVDDSDLAEGSVMDGREIRHLKGNVALRHENTFMYCDSATLEGNIVVATGNVIIQQGDSLNIFADSLHYDGDSKLADLYGDVRLDNKGQKLFTNHLNYDLEKDIAKYEEKSLLTKDSTYIQSNRGTYWVKEERAEFREKVVVIDTAFTLRSDSLDFSTETGVLTFIAPTLVTQKEAKIYCEKGFYDTKENYAEFLQNAQYVNKDQASTADLIAYDGKLKEVVLKGNAVFKEKDKIAQGDQIKYKEDTEVITLEGNAIYEDKEKQMEGDKILYDAKNEVFETEGRSTIVDGSKVLDADTINYVGNIGIAKGNVIWTDTIEQVKIESNRIEYDKEVDYIKASGDRPLLTTVLDGDTMFMRSDTLISFKDTTTVSDSARIFLGYHNVRVFKSNLQAVCDSLVYNSADSLFSFFQKPIIWSDTSQFSADTIHLQMKREQIDKIDLNTNAFIINSPDEIYYNQIKGEDMVAYFREEELYKMYVLKNAEVIYYIRNEEEAYSGVNKSTCEEMMINFVDNEITTIMFYAEPNSTLFPMKGTNHNDLKLNGFKWEQKRRPRSAKDLNLFIK